MFKYGDDFDLIRGQSAMIEIAFHCLIMAENVRYEFKRDYYEILSQIFMRDELKLTNLALSAAESKSLFIKLADNSSKINLSENQSKSIKKETLVSG